MTANFNMSFQVAPQEGGFKQAQKSKDANGQPFGGKSKDGQQVSFAELFDRSSGLVAQTNRRVSFSSNISDNSIQKDNLAQVKPEAANKAALGGTKGDSVGMDTSLEDSSRDDVAVLSDDKVEACKEALVDICDGIMANLSGELGVVDEEKLDEAMEVLELSYMDLLNPQVFEDVIEQIAEELPEVELLVSAEDFVASQIPLNEGVVDEVFSDKGISLEEFAGFLEQVEEEEIELPDELLSKLPTSEIEEGNPLSQAIINEDFSNQFPQAVALDDESTNINAPMKVVVQESITVIKLSDDEFAGENAKKLVPEEEDISEADLEMDIEEADDGDVGIISEDMPRNPLNEAASKPVAEALDADEDGLGETTINKRPQMIDGEEMRFSSESDDSSGGEETKEGETAFSGRQAIDTESSFNQNPVFINQDTPTFAESLQEINRTVSSFTSRQTADIINQIVSQAQTTISETVSRMEMELNPQHLGRMIMQVQQQDGVLTAKLIAENENVRQALEKQLIKLQESLDEKGIKVNAVEVSVGTHEFERNLEEGAQNPFARDDGTEDGQQGRGRQRNLNRSELEGEEPIELSEEDELAARIMQANGGTVDYTA